MLYFRDDSPLASRFSRQWPDVCSPITGCFESPPGAFPPGKPYDRERDSDQGRYAANVPNGMIVELENGGESILRKRLRSIESRRAGFVQAGGKTAGDSTGEVPVGGFEHGVSHES